MTSTTGDTCGDEYPGAIGPAAGFAWQRKRRSIVARCWFPGIGAAELRATGRHQRRSSLRTPPHSPRVTTSTEPALAYVEARTRNRAAARAYAGCVRPAARALLVVLLIARVGAGAYHPGRASIDGSPARVPNGSFTDGYRRGTRVCALGFDGGWSYGEPYVVALRRGGSGINYRFAQRELMLPGHASAPAAAGSAPAECRAGPRSTRLARGRHGAGGDQRGRPAARSSAPTRESQGSSAPCRPGEWPAPAARGGRAPVSVGPDPVMPFASPEASSRSRT